MTEMGDLLGSMDQHMIEDLMVHYGIHLHIPRGDTVIPLYTAHVVYH